MTQIQTHQEQVLRNLIQYGLLAFAKEQYPSNDAKTPGIKGVYDTVVRSYQSLGMNDELADKMTKAIYFHVTKKLLETNSSIHLIHPELSGDYFKNKKGSDIAELLINQEMLQEHTDYILEDYSPYLLSNLQKHAYGPKLEEMTKTYSLGMPLRKQQADKKPELYTSLALA